MKLPTLRNIDMAKRIYDQLNGWKLANRVISSYYKEHLANLDEGTVLIKVVLVSTLYFARIFEPLRMAAHIVRLLKLDRQLQIGEIEAVERIASFDRYEMSFASKYAHFHNSAAYPMYDSFVSKAIAQLQGRGLSLSKYANFFDTIEVFRREAGLPSVSWVDLDKYLWLYGQKKALDKGNKTINKEVTALYDSPEGHNLFEALEP